VVSSTRIGLVIDHAGLTHPTIGLPRPPRTSHSGCALAVRDAGWTRKGAHQSPASKPLERIRRDMSTMPEGNCSWLVSSQSPILDWWPSSTMTYSHANVGPPRPSAANTSRFSCTSDSVTFWK
jgi:hypothetical protein